MASVKLKPHHPIKPGHWLGFFIAAVAVIGVACMAWELWQMSRNISSTERTFGFDGTKWLAFLGGWGAILGALISARITLRNGVKQHTITTLLQMRMSETYIGRVSRVGAVYFPPGEAGIYLVREGAFTQPNDSDRLADLTYVLNYLEFIASAIRYGDLDEGLMKETLRGIVCNLFECGQHYIRNRRKIGQNGGNPLLYEHLEWLYRRWFIEKYRKPWLIRPEHLSIN